MAKYRAKFGWPTLSDVGVLTTLRREIRWNLLGCPKLPNRSQSLMGRSPPYYENMWRRYCCFYDCRYMPSLRKYSPTKLCDGGQMANFWRFFASCISASRLQHIQTCILNSHWKKRRQKKPQDKKYNGLPYWTAIKRVNIYSVRKQNTLDHNSNMHNITDLNRMSYFMTARHTALSDAKYLKLNLPWRIDICSFVGHMPKLQIYCRCR